MMSNQIKSRFRIIVWGLLLIVALPLSADAQSAWQANTLQKYNGNDRIDQGLILFTTDPDENGAAFHCHFGEMAAYLWDQPVNIRKLVLDDRARRGTDFQVKYRIDDVPEGRSHWRKLHNSPVYEVKGRKDVEDVFLAATQGLEISFSHKYGDPVVVYAPVAEAGMVEEFLDACELKERFLP